MEEKMEAIDRMRAHGLTLQQGAPHQVLIGNDIILLCDLASTSDKPVSSDNSMHEITARGRAIEHLTNECARLITEREEALGKVVGLDTMTHALLFIAQSRFEPDNDPFMVLLRKTARDALDEAGIDWSEVDPAQLTLPPMEPLSGAAKPTGGRAPTPTEPHHALTGIGTSEPPIGLATAPLAAVGKPAKTKK